MKQDKLRRQFEEECACSFDYSYVGKFPKYSNTSKKWILVPRGQVWEEYAEFLEKKINENTKNS